MYCWHCERHYRHDDGVVLDAWYSILYVSCSGKVEKAVADKIAIEEYEKYNQRRIVQNISDDFDKFIENNNLKK